MDYYDEIHGDEMHERNTLNPMDIKDMCAKEAKERADAFNKARSMEDFKNIMSAIIDAAKEGQYSYYIDRFDKKLHVTSEIKGKLEALGYKVEIKEVQDNRQIVISWKGEEYGR
jgi:hypothetical protein